MGRGRRIIWEGEEDNMGRGRRIIWEGGGG